MKQSMYLHYLKVYLIFFIFAILLFVRVVNAQTTHWLRALSARTLRVVCAQTTFADSARWVEKRPRFARSARRQNHRPRVVCAFQQGTRTLVTHHQNIKKVRAIFTIYKTLKSDIYQIYCYIGPLFPLLQKNNWVNPMIWENFAVR